MYSKGSPDFERILIDGTTYEVEYVAIDADSGDTTVVSGVEGLITRVLHYEIVVASLSVTSVQWKSSTTSLSGQMSTSSRDRRATAYNPFGVMETAVGEDLVLTVGGSGNNASGHLSYVQYRWRA